MPFGFFKKKKKEELHYDPTNIRVTDVRKGFLLDYDFKTWEVVEEYEYDWGKNFFTHEFKLVCQDDSCFLSVVEGDELELYIVKKINIARLGATVEESIAKLKKPPRTLDYEGVTYLRSSEGPGHFRNIDDTEWYEFIAWDYYDETEEKVLTIEQWDEEEFEASAGIWVEEHAFSNILPA